MRLIYDIAVMAQLVAACQSANTEIVKAEQLVQQVRSHGDWTCKEKSVIDELMQECKTLVQRMREDQGSFLQVLKEVEGELNDTENSVSNLFSGVESILSKVLAIPVAQTVAIGGGLLGAAVGASGIRTKINDGLVNISAGITDVIQPGALGTGWASDLLDKMKEIGEGITDIDLIWHGPGPILGGLGGLADVWENPWLEARRTNPNVTPGGISAGPIPSRMTDWYQDRIQDSLEQAGIGIGDLIDTAIPTTMTDVGPEVVQPVLGGMINHIHDTAGDFVDMAEQIAHISGTTAYPTDWNRPDVVGAVKDALENVGEAVTPIVSPVTGVVIDVWNQVQDSPLGDVVGDALRNIVEPIAICGMNDLVL